MNDGLPINSIEDEGIDMGGVDYNSIGLSASALQSHSNWDFQNLNHKQNFLSGAGSEVDANDNSDDEFNSAPGSAIAEHNSSASSNSLLARVHDFDNTPAEGDGEDGVFEEPSPVPDIDDDDDRVDTLMLHREVLHARHDAAVARPEFKVTPSDAPEEVEEPATEIHVEDGEGLKMD